MTYFVGTIFRLANMVRKTHEKKLAKVVEAISWPYGKNGIGMSDISLPQEDIDSLSSIFSKLLDLQKALICVMRSAHQAKVEVVLGDSFLFQSKHSLPCDDPRSLEPFAALMAPLLSRFRKHFGNGKFETSRLDKPEWFFSSAKEIIENNVQFITKYIQPLLPKGYNATNGFIASVVEECCEKILFDIKQGDVIHDAELFIYTLKEGIRFHNSIHKLFNYPLSSSSDFKEDDEEFGKEHDMEKKRNTQYSISENPKAKYPTISSILLENFEILSAWADAERNLAVSNFEAIVQDTKAWEEWEVNTPQTMDDLGLTKKSLPRPTNSSFYFVQLIQDIIDSFSPIPQSEARAHFFIKIQIPLLQRYMHEIAMKKAERGIDSLRQQIPLFLSCSHVIFAIGEWMKFPVFSSFQIGPEKSQPDVSLFGLSKILSTKTQTSFSDPLKILLDVHSQYKRLKSELRDRILLSISSPIILSVKQLLQTVPETTQENAVIPGLSQDVSPQIVEVVSLLRGRLKLLSSLPTSQYMRIWIGVAKSVDTSLTEHICSLKKKSISTQFAHQICTDIKTIISCFEVCSQSPFDSFPLLRDIISLLCVPIGTVVTCTREALGSLASASASSSASDSTSTSSSSQPAPSLALSVPQAAAAVACRFDNSVTSSSFEIGSNALK
eukprot:TRINITY_DN676_c1_g1_i1.p1 TRINITY_DN676_c1_g1~~TRINITY_DN676_c1_g1_i1.p1  ORF type:complete len:666 (-),score=185.95 TRINITY_DN676_c1_g1_i1:27-2024(-)